MDYMSFDQSGHKCLVCGADNLLSFIDLTLVTARTSQSNTPVRDKLKCIIKHKWINVSDVMILCTPCFNMVERYDQLESELLQIQNELSLKYAHTVVPEDEQNIKQESKRIRKEDHESGNWQQQVPVDLLQPVVNLTAGGDSEEDSGSDEDNSLCRKSSRKRTRRVSKIKENVVDILKDKKSNTGKSRGRPRKDTPYHPLPTPPSLPEEESKERAVFEYDYSCPFFKEGERLRIGQSIIDEASQTSYVVCIYCPERRSDGKDISAHTWSMHKPQVVGTVVPTDDGNQQEHNFGVQVFKVSTDSQALGRQFICIFCDSTFKFKSNLLQHFRENHSPHKPFSCIECKAKFRRSIEVSRHRVYYCPNKKPIPGGRSDDNLSSQ